MFSVEKLKEKFNITGRILVNEPLSERTSMKVGGKAPLLFIPDKEEGFVRLLGILKTNDFQNYFRDFMSGEGLTPYQHGLYFILGGGTNIVVSDKGFSCPVVSTGGLCDFEILGNEDERFFVRAGAGLPMNRLVNLLKDASLGSMAEFAGLPGSCGGAVFMNARCFNSSVSDFFVSAKIFDMDRGVTDEVFMDPSAWDYKKSPFQEKSFVILSVVFAVNKVSREKIEEKMRESVNLRKEKGHYLFPSAGSVFKNNRSFGKPTGAIIDSVGLKGLTRGGAKVAPWHGNIIINGGNATASDIRSLVEEVKKTVLEKTGFNLDCEIFFVGDD